MKIKRTPIHIYRLNNQLFLHFVLCKAIIGSKLKVVSARKFYGSYLHALVPHAGLQTRIVSGMTAFAEGEESLFQQAKSLTKRTSNNQTGNVISNILIRSQVEEELKIHLYGQHGERWVNEQNIVSNLYNEIMIVKNTFIKKEFIRKNENDWQSYLETIADFISLGEGVSWCQSENGIKFYDTNLSQAMPELHDYRSWNLHEEQEYLREKWQYCQDNPTTIPAQSIKIYDSEGNLTTKKY